MPRPSLRARAGGGSALGREIPGARALLEQEQEGRVGTPGLAPERDLAVAVRADAGVEVAAFEIAADLAQRRRRQLGVQEPAVAGHAAAGGAGRDVDALGEPAEQRLEGALHAEVPGRARRMDRDRAGAP